MENTIKTVRELVAKFEENLAKYENGNAAAGRRARLASVELEKAMKEFRRLSVQ